MTIQKYVDLSSLSTTPLWVPGEYYWGQDGKLWQYVKFNSITATGVGVSIAGDGTFLASLGDSAVVTTARPIMVGFYQGSTSTAANQYGWVFRGFGSFTGSAAAAIAINVKIYFTAAATGVVDDASAGSPLSGVFCTTAVGGAGAVNLFATGLISGASF